MNFNIAIDNSGFKPFDLDTVYKALDFYNKGYDKNKEVYDKISQTLGELSTAVEGTEKAKNIYDAYRSQFDTAADSFAQGMTTENSRLLGKLRSLYGTDVMKLEEARKAMKAVADARSKLAATGKANDMLYQSIGNLDNYLDNPNYSPKAYDGNQITASSAAIMDKLKSDIVDASKGKAITPDSYLYEVTKGMSSTDVTNLINGINEGTIDPLKIKGIGDALQNVLNTAGYNDWMDEATKKKAMDYAVRGLYGLIGGKDVKLTDNWQYREDYKHKQELEKAAIAQQYAERNAYLNAYLKDADVTPNGDGTYSVTKADGGADSPAVDDLINNPVPFYEEIDSEKKQTANAAAQSLQSYIKRGYFVVTHNAQGKEQYRLSTKGEQVYNQGATHSKDTWGDESSLADSSAVQFYNFLNTYGGYNKLTKYQRRGGNAYNHLVQGIAKSATPYSKDTAGHEANAYQIPAYKWNIAAGDRVDKILKGQDFVEAVYDKQSHSYKAGKAYSIPQTSSEQGNFSSVKISKNGTVYIYKDAEGESHTLMLKTSLFPDAEKNVKGLLTMSSAMSNLVDAYNNKTTNPSNWKTAVKNLQQAIVKYNSTQSDPRNKIQAIDEKSITPNIIAGLKNTTIPAIISKAYQVQSTAMSALDVDEIKVGQANPNID